jgi:hypothetical protein
MKLCTSVQCRWFLSVKLITSSSDVQTEFVHPIKSGIGLVAKLQQPS